MNEAHDAKFSEKRSIIRRHTNSWEPEFPTALVFDPNNPDKVTEEEANEQNSKLFPVASTHARNHNI